MEALEETVHDTEYNPDHTMLLGATLMVVLGAYTLCQLPWPWLQTRKEAKRHRSAASHPSVPRPQSPQCSQLSPRKTPAHVQPASTLQSDFRTAASSQHDGPFRFRAPDAADIDELDWTSAEEQERQQQHQHQQHQGTEEWELEKARQELQQQLEQQQFSTPLPAQWQGQQQQQQQQQEEGKAEGEEEEQEQHDLPHEQQQPGSSWEPELLARCAVELPYISSVEALQCSSRFRSHIRRIRGQRLLYETTESRKLQVYKALHDVDPAGFVQLLSRKDVHEYDEEPPSRLLSAAEGLATAAVNLTLLVVPWLVCGLGSYRLLGALTWIALTLISASRGCTSPVACLLQIHATQGEYNMLPNTWGLVAAAVLEAGLVAFTAGAGVFVTLGYRLFNQQKQSFSDRVLRYVPLRQVVRPMQLLQVPHATGPGVIYLDD